MPLNPKHWTKWDGFCKLSDSASNFLNVVCIKHEPSKQEAFPKTCQSSLHTNVQHVWILRGCSQTRLTSPCCTSATIWPHWLTDWLTVNWSQLRAINCCSSPAGQWRHVDSITAAVTADNCWVSMSANRLPAVETPDTRWLSLLTSASLNLLLKKHHCVCMCVCFCHPEGIYLMYFNICPHPHNMWKQLQTKRKTGGKKVFLLRNLSFLLLPWQHQTASDAGDCKPEFRVAASGKHSVITPAPWITIYFMTLKEKKILLRWLKQNTELIYRSWFTVII